MKFNRSIVAVFVCFTAVVAILTARPSLTQGAASEPVAENMASLKFMNFPALPTCVTGTVLSGDPMHGASTLLIKVAAGCSIPWHWHSADEVLMISTGVAVLQMQGAKPVALHPGGYAVAPAKHVHRFHCLGSCAFFLQPVAAFDIHYVGAKGEEISPAAALKRYHEKATPMPAAK